MKTDLVDTQNGAVLGSGRAENYSLLGACSKFGNPIRTYDDGFGDLWIYQESRGVVGIIRTKSWFDAWDCVLDEILKPIPNEDLIEAYGFYTLPEDMWNPQKPPFHALRDCGEKLATFDKRTEAVKYCLDTIVREECDLVEGYEYQSNASGTGIVAIDLNGNYLSPLSPELLEQEEIILILETDD